MYNLSKGSTLLARRLGPDFKRIRVRVIIRIYLVDYFIVIYSVAISLLAPSNAVKHH